MMKSDTPLESVVFQLDESRSRCELWIYAGTSSERLASGYLTPFVSHLQAAQEELVQGGDCIRLEAPDAQGSPWFSKRTIERFVRFVSTPDVLERVSYLETESVKLAEASNILKSESSQIGISFSAPEGGSAGKQKMEKGIAQAHVGEHSMDTLEMETESSRKHLINAMDARRRILEKEQRNAFTRAAAAGFTIDSLSDLNAFAESFGATRLREACAKFTDLHRKLFKPEVGKEKIGEEDQGKEQQVERVKNYGRRRVWGPPVAEIPLQMPVNGGVPDSDVLEWKDANGAFTPNDFDSPQKSTLSSEGRESDWEEKEGNNENPVYANVLGQFSSKEGTEDTGGMKQEVGQVEPAVRRKGIVVIKNIRFPQAGASTQESDTESDKDSANETKEVSGGRLSVQAAISLFETKQKKSSEVTKQQPEKKSASDRRWIGKQDFTKHEQRTNEALNDPSSIQRGNTVCGKSQLSMVKRERSPRNGGIVQETRLEVKGAKTEPGDMTLQKTANGDSSHRKSKTADDIKKELLDRTQQRIAASNQTATKSADDVSKELLDRSYSCLLKISSVVQDALLSASALRQTKKLEEARPNTDMHTEWRSLSNVSTMGLDDMFTETNVITKGTPRRQSLCPHDRTSTLNQMQSNEATTPAHDHQKGRLYDQYQEIREAKYKKESTLLRAERESKLRAMQDVLERRKTELMGSRLPEKNNTLTAEQIKAMKVQAMKNNLRKEVRPDFIKGLQNEKSATRKTSTVLRSKQESSPNSANTTSSTRKISPGPPKPPVTTPRNSTRLSSSPRSKYSSNGPPVSQRRMPNFMSQSVISESLHTQADLRKENAKPSTGRNRNTTHDQAVLPLRYSHSRADKVNRNLVLETSPSAATRAEDKRLGAAGRRGMTSDARESQILAPIKIARDMSLEQRKVKRDLSKSQNLTRIPTPRPLTKTQIASTGGKLETDAEIKPDQVGPDSSTPVGAVTKTNEECIKKIVSCISKDKNEDSPDGNKSSFSASAEAQDVPLVFPHDKVSESFKEQPTSQESLSRTKPSTETFESMDFDDDMQIDEALEKCMSGKAFPEGISASPLTAYQSASTTKDHCCKQELSSSLSLRTGPSSQSLPHLQRSVSPSALATFRNDFAAKEIKALCKEHHQSVGHRDQPKGLMRLLKFGRKSRGSDTSISEWSTVIDDFSINNSRSCRKNLGIEENTGRTSGSSGVRRSLEALPKIADAATRNFFSTFRSKSSASESRSRAC